MHRPPVEVLNKVRLLNVNKLGYCANVNSVRNCTKTIGYPLAF